MSQNVYAPPAAPVADPGSETERMTWGEILFSFHGRIPRKAYWLYGSLPVTLVVVILEIFANAMGARWLGVLIQILSIWPMAAVCVKRCHDRNRSGWFYLLCAIPLVNFWPFVELGFLRGTEGNNRFGTDATGAY